MRSEATKSASGPRLGANTDAQSVAVARSASGGALHRAAIASSEVIEPSAPATGPPACALALSEAELQSSAGQVRPIVLRPSLIWSWDKLDVLPAIPIFNLASAIGVPFVDKTVRVETLGKAAVSGLLDPSVSGVQRVERMEELASAL